MEPSSSSLSIDWRLLLLQVGNFLFLLGILSWLVWKPLVKSIDERRKAIADGIAAAEAQRAAAEAAEQENTKRLAEARAEATQLVAQTRAELKAERDVLKKELAAEQERLRHANQKELQLAHTKLEAELRGSLADLVIRALTQVLQQTPDDPKRWQAAVAAAVKELE